MQLQSSARRAAWNDPVRKLRTLESFARTEADGGRDLLAAAARVGDPELRRSLELHARDELRHAELFQRRADELRPLVAPLAATSEGSDRAYDLSRGRPKGEVDLHGFFSESLCDELGEVAYVAMLHVAERRAQALFERQRALVRDDPRADLEGVRCPSLVLWGARDRQVPIGDAFDYARRLRAPCRTIADCGHLLIGERPEAVADAIESFLGEPS